MYTLDSFRHSKKWSAFVDQLKLERLNDDGEIICAHCGRPITKKYDCIGHHKIELTEENVNDFTISLNPENVDLIHFRCHNMIHERFEGRKQSVYLVYGPPCAGKSTWVRDVAYPDDLILDIDELWSAVSTCDKFSKPPRLKANIFGLRDCIIDQVRTRTGLWRNAYIIGGYPLRTDRERLCNLLQASAVYIDAPRDVCISRAKTEDWKSYVDDWFETFIP